MTLNSGCRFTVALGNNAGCIEGVEHSISTSLNRDGHNSLIFKLTASVLLHQILSAGHRVNLTINFSNGSEESGSYFFSNDTPLSELIRWLEQMVLPGMKTEPPVCVNKITSKIKDCSVHAARKTLIELNGRSLTQSFPGISLQNSEECTELLYEQYLSLLGVLQNQSNIPLGQLPFSLTQRQVDFIHQAGGHAREFQQRDFVIDQIEAQAASHPDNPALVFEQKKLNYAELNSSANTLANQLQIAGVGKGDLVPILTKDVVLLVVSILALMKLEAPFVICDFCWPDARRRRLLEKIDIRFLLTSAHERSDAMDFNGVQLCEVNLDDLNDVTVNLKYQRVDSQKDDALYGFFTSGTTGLPKCCINTQKGLLNRFNNMSFHLNLARDETVLVNSNLTFDSALWQILWPLTQGARIILPTDEQRCDVRETLDLMGKYQVVMTDFVPSIFRLLVQLLFSKEETNLKLTHARYIIVGGEKVNANCIRRFYQHVHNTVLMNTYGPTEAAIGMMFYKIPRGVEDIPIGNPISNTYAVVVDDNNRPCAPGVMGEILIGGVCLGTGYVNEPEKNREVFVNNPFSWIPGDRLYRTGDLGYLRLDGCFQFITRINDCVKVNGVMVNLSEIEETIKESPKVDSACVVVNMQGTVNGIYAYIITQDSVDLEQLTAELEKHLPAQLPKTSLPKKIIYKDKFPLSPNGKVDKKALAADLVVVERERRNRSNFDCEVKNSIHQVIGDVIKSRSLLGDQNLLDEGMDSVSAQVICIELERIFKTRLPLSALFYNPTINGIADFFSGKQSDEKTLQEALIRQDMALLDDLCYLNPLAENEEAKGVLLTGSTGFVGAHLLAQLIEDLDEEENIYVLVRGKDHKNAMERLKESFNRYRLNVQLLLRVNVITGNICQANFGCQPEQLAVMFAGINRIVLNAAHVNLLLGYDRLRSSNTLSIVNTIELMKQFGRKDIVYISSLAVLNTLAKSNSRIPENMNSRDITLPRGGYAQSKWVAECLLERARLSGLRVSILRLGEVMPSAATGADNQSSFFSNLVKLVVQSQCGPKTDAKIAYTPVDYVTQILSRMIRCNNIDQSFKNYHLFHPESVSFEEIVSQLAKKGGRQINFIDNQDFFRVLVNTASPEFEDMKSKVVAVLNQFEGSDPLNHYFSNPSKDYDQQNLKDWIATDKLWMDHDERSLNVFAENIIEEA